MRRCSESRRNGIADILRYLRDYMRAAPVCTAFALVVDLGIALLPSAVSVATAAVTEHLAGGGGIPFSAAAAVLLALLCLSQGLLYISDLCVDYAVSKAQ